MTIDLAAGVVNWLPALGDVGNANVLIVVTDGHGGESTQAFDLQVVADAANVPPTIISAPGEIIKSGLIYRYRVQANDPNADPLTFQLDVAPAGMTIDGEGLIAWRPTVTELGLHPVSLRVEDGRGGIDTQDFTLQVNSLTSIQAPTIVSNPPFTATVDEQYRYDVQATAPNGSTLLFDFSTAPTGMSIDPWLGTIVWRPTAEQIGPRDVVVQVFDGLGSSTSQHFAVQVSSVNYSPSISSTPPTEAYVDDVYTYAVHTTDPEGDSLSFSMAGPPAMTIDPTTGLIQWTPTSTDVGVHSLVVVVSDGRLVGRQTFDLEVIAGTPNAAPNITSRPTFLATVDQPYEYQLVASDPEGDAISYDLPGFPFGMTVDTNGLVAWTPVAGQEGPHVVTLVASDSNGAWSAQQFTLTAATNDAPTIISSSPTTVAAGAIYRYDVQVQDPDGDTVLFGLSAAPAGMTIDAFGRLEWSPLVGDIGSSEVEIIVTDGRGGEDRQNFALDVTTDQVAPRLQITLSDNPINLLEEVDVVVVAVQRRGSHLHFAVYRNNAGCFGRYGPSDIALGRGGAR